jgi:phosphoribosylamine--glycine ligase
MKILVIGGGAREHALAWKLSSEAEVLAAPGNAGMQGDCECVDVKASDHAGLVELCRRRRIDLVVIGPEDPLVAGLADDLRGAGFAVFGPGRAGAQLEARKEFSKAAMVRAGVPTAAYASFSDADPAVEFAREKCLAGKGVVVKANGNALGKGVIVAPGEEAAVEAIERMLVHREFGDAGSTVVIEETLFGREFSLLTIVGEQNFMSLPVAQDYKRVGDGDQGPNTGGMGSFSPVPAISEDLVAETEARVVAPIVAELKSRHVSFRGLLFSGLMLEPGGLKCLEYNVRFGDPEAESLMLRLGSGLAAALHAAATGDRIGTVEVQDNHAVSVFVASAGYPGSYPKGRLIEMGELPAGSKLFHAGTSRVDGNLVTSGGRVICASASGTTLEEARLRAYSAAQAVRFEGAFFRRDIGQC